MTVICRWRVVALLVLVWGRTAGSADTPGAAADGPASIAPQAAPSSFFGLTNLWTFHITLSEADWQLLGSRGGPQPRGFGGMGGMGGMGGRQGFNNGLAVPMTAPFEGPAPVPVQAPPPAPPGLFQGLIQRFFGGETENAPPPAPPAPPPRTVLVQPRPMPSQGGPQRGPDLAEAQSNHPWGSCRFEGGGVTLTNVGIRFKGVSSLVRAPNGYKRPFKLDFNRGVKGQRFMGVEAINLNNNVNDATQMHEALAYDLFRQAGVPAPRTAFARVFLTIPGRFENRLLGLYTVVEDVDGAFLERSFGSAQGLLMKPDMMRGVQYLGPMWEAYEERFHPRIPKGGLNPEDPKKLMGFLRFLQAAPADQFAEGLAQYLEPELFLKFVAINALLANVDSFIGNGHNYFLYLHPVTRKLTFFPWDLNESFGAHPVSGPSRMQMLHSVLRPNADPNLLVERVVSDPVLGPQYRVQCAALLTNLFVASRLAAVIDRVAAVTGPVVAAESKRARADFDRTVLETLRPDEGDTSVPRFDRELGGDGYRPWSFPDAVEIDNLPIKAWIAGREANVRDQLAGRVAGTRPRPRLNGGYY